MTRKLIRTFAIAALFSGLTSSTVVLGEQSRLSSPAPLCQQMTSECGKRMKTMEQMSQNQGKCITQMKDACSRMIQGSNKANPCVSK